MGEEMKVRVEDCDGKVWSYVNSSRSQRAKHDCELNVGMLAKSVVNDGQSLRIQLGRGLILAFRADFPSP
jgi:hypothetical protein